MQAATRDPAIDISSIHRERVRLDRVTERRILAP
jgi:hypothetical protein